MIQTQHATLLRAGLAFAALGLALHACTPEPVFAAPPAGYDPNSALSVWLRTLRDVRGVGCCDASDCHRTAIRPTDSGRVEAWIGKEQFGDSAPDEWHLIPTVELRSREDRPPGVRGAWVCFYGGKVMCADIEGGF